MAEVGAIAIVTGASALTFGVLSGVVILSERILKLKNRILKNKASNEKKVLIEIRETVAEIVNGVSDQYRQYEKLGLVNPND